MPDPFKSSVFFPKPKGVSDVSGMTQCLNSGLPVFARDSGKGALKSYFACGYEHFCFNLYKNGQDRYRNVYELLQMDRPTKIYLDFDHSEVNDKVKFNDSTNKFVKHVYSLLLEKTGREIPFYVLDASTDKKLSLHVIFECFLADIPTVQGFVQAAKDGCQCDYLDGAVYTRNRLFRLIYSHKFNKSPESALRVKGTRHDAEYDPLLVFKTMIQAMLPVHYFGPFASLKDSVATSVTFIKLDATERHVNGYSGATCNSLPNGFDSLIETMGGTLLSCKENDSFITCIVGGKCCPWRQLPHKNNNQYFTLCKSNLKGYFECADSECEKTPYDRIDVSFLWRKQLLEQYK